MSGRTVALDLAGTLPEDSDNALLVGRIHDEFEQAVRTPEVVERLARSGVEPAQRGTPAQFAAMVDADSLRWARVIRERKISID